MGFYNYTKFHANPLDGYEEVESKMISHTFCTVAVTSFTHCYLSALTRSLLEVNMCKRKRLGPLRMVDIRNSEVGRYSGGVNVQYERQNKSVPEVASAIWSESAIRGVRYRRLHCIA